MKKILYVFAVILAAAACQKPEKPIVLDFENFGQPTEYTDQMRFAYVDRDSVGIYNLKTQELEWAWTASNSPELASHVRYFKTMDEVKPVNHCEDLMVCSTSGGVAIIHIADKSIRFFAIPMGQPHSMEMLPDGNIVVATSVTSDGNGNMLKLYRMPAPGASPYVAEPFYAVDNYSGHNVVWDNCNDVLWATSDNVIKMYAYDMKAGKLKVYNTINLPTSNAHELFPVYGEDKMWLTTGSAVYKFDVYTYSCTKVAGRNTSNIKCVSSGPSGFPTLIISPKTSYYTDTVIDITGETHFVKKDAQFYKVRWMLDNSFSYNE